MNYPIESKGQTFFNVDGKIYIRIYGDCNSDWFYKEVELSPDEKSYRIVN